MTTIRVTQDLTIELGPHEEIVGIEILDDSEYLGLSKEKRVIELENLALVLLKSP